MKFKLIKTAAEPEEPLGSEFILGPKGEDPEVEESETTDSPQGSDMEIPEPLTEEDSTEAFALTEEEIKNDVRVKVSFFGLVPKDEESNLEVNIYKLIDGIWTEITDPIDCKSKVDLTFSSVKKLSKDILNEVYDSVRNNQDKDYDSICKRMCRDASTYEINEHTASGPGEATLTVEGKIKKKIFNWKMHLDDGNITIVSAPTKKKALIKAKLMCKAYGLENCDFHLKPASQQEVDYITSMGGLIHEDVLKEAVSSWTPQTDQVESNIFPVAGTPLVPTPEFPVGIKNDHVDLGMGISTERDQYGVYPGFYPQAHLITEEGFRWRLKQIKDYYPNSKDPVLEAKGSSDPIIRRYAEELGQKTADTRYSNPDPMSQDPIATVKSKGVPLKGMKVKMKKSKNFGYNRPWATETEATEGNSETHLGYLKNNSVKINKVRNMKNIIAKIEQQISEGYAIDEILVSLKKEAASVKATELTKVLATISQAVDGILQENGVMDSPVTKEAASQLDECRDHLEQINEATGSFLSNKAQTHIRNFVHAVDTMMNITVNPHIKNYCQVIAEGLNEINEISTLRKMNVEEDANVKHHHKTDHKTKVKGDLNSFVNLSKQVQKDKKFQEKEIYKMFVDQLEKHTEKLEKIYDELGEFHNPEGEAVISNLHTIINNIKVIAEEKTLKNCSKMLHLLELIGHHGELHTKLIKEIQPVTPLEYTPITDTHEEIKDARTASALGESDLGDMPGCTLVYDEEPYVIFEIDKNGSAALSRASEGTKWTTIDSEKAKAILNRSTVYIVFKNGTPYAQISQAYDYIGIGLYANNITIKSGEDKELEEVMDNLGLSTTLTKRYNIDWKKSLDKYKKSDDINKTSSVKEAIKKIAAELLDDASVEDEAALDEEASLETIDLDALLTVLPTETEIGKTFVVELDPETMTSLKSYITDSGLASSQQVDDLAAQENSLICDFGVVTAQELIDLTRGTYSIKDTDKITFGPFEVGDFFIKNDIHIDADMLIEQ